MPKDTKGHGSNGMGIKGLRRMRDHLAGQVKSGLMNPPTTPKPIHDGHPKSQPVPAHGGTEGVGPNDPRAGSRDYDSFGRPRDDLGKGEYDEYNRDLGQRARNGGIGSGGRR